MKTTMRSTARLLLALGMGLGAASAAHATVIGATYDSGGTLVAGSEESFGFYIPISEDGSGDFGAAGDGGAIGQTVDYCTIGSADGCGGYLNMDLHFDATTAGAATLALGFVDLDVEGLNTPEYLLETLEVSAGGTALTPSDTLMSGDYRVWLFETAATAGQTDFDLRFSTSFSPLLESGTYMNTQERMISGLQLTASVPEPGTLSLLGAGLLAAGFAGRRRLKRNDAA